MMTQRTDVLINGLDIMKKTNNNISSYNNAYVSPLTCVLPWYDLLPDPYCSYSLSLVIIFDTSSLRILTIL